MHTKWFVFKKTLIKICLFSLPLGTTAYTHIQNTHTHTHILSHTNIYTILDTIEWKNRKLFYFQHKKQSKSTCEYVEENYLNRLDLYVCFIQSRFPSNSAISFCKSIDFDAIFSLSLCFLGMPFKYTHELWIEIVCMRVSFFRAEKPNRWNFFRLKTLQIQTQKPYCNLKVLSEMHFANRIESPIKHSIDDTHIHTQIIRINCNRSIGFIFSVCWWHLNC